ncbi:uncharacterized protein si:dkeyp-69c1.9 [Hippocampus zosterae]|uniref:uncharacterized protein si:dkeyp-69c1.9 n=1 Tax=Hippocampus zosterae TaxID=109293 RepID=UPI00223DBFF9|nr:uncharacterized protein si:dkeyp-69c1.9 [Hippocampus zosterae]
MEQSENIFIENLQRAKHRRDFFRRARPYRGELPTVAGFLLYPDTPAKMETTSREAFCFRTVLPRDSGKDCIFVPNAQNSRQETRHSHVLSSRQTGSVKSRHVEADEQADICDGNQDAEMLSQYQKDFPPPSSWRRRRTPAMPQPDNIGINRAFGIEFGTVHRETYRNWHDLNIGRVRSTIPGSTSGTLH